MVVELVALLHSSLGGNNNYVLTHKLHGGLRAVGLPPYIVSACGDLCPTEDDIMGKGHHLRLRSQAGKGRGQK
jgi:hypothetical protein